MDKLARRLTRSGPIVLDGGLATQLESMGYDIGGDLWSAALLAGNPQAIVAAHRAYLDAGAEIVISASYQASRSGFADLGYGADEADRIIASSVSLAAAARRDFLAANPDSMPPLIAASVGPWGATQHNGSEYTGAYDVGDAELESFHAQRLRVLDSAGADLLAVETIPNRREAAILARLLTDVGTPGWVSFVCRDAQSLSDGTPIREVAALFAGHRTVAAVGVNCTAPRFVLALIRELRSAAPDRAIVVYPNSGETFRSADKSWSGTACDLDKDFDVAAWQAAGAKLIGGCCRIGPADIAAIRQRLSAGAA